MSAVGALTLGQITAEVREVTVAKGFRRVDGPDGNTWADYIALLHSEVAEALEAYRDHRLADATGEFGEGECSCAMSEASMNNCSVHGPDARIKPEGVGSELADVFIRLVDMMDVFGRPLPDVTIAEVVKDWPAAPAEGLLGGEGFGGWMAWLHHWADRLWLEQESLRWMVGQQVLAALAITAERFGIDLEAEYRRKIAYNRTRTWRHGGRTLAGPGPGQVGRQVVEQIKAHVAARTAPLPNLPPASPEGRLDRLTRKIPESDEAFWEPVQTKAFMDVWAWLGLPVLGLYDASGEVLTLWVKTIDLAANMLGVEVEPYGLGRGFELTKGAYIVCVLHEG